MDGKCPVRLKCDSSYAAINKWWCLWCFLIAIREWIHKTTSPLGSAAATCPPLRQKSSHFSTRSRGWRSTAWEQSNTRVRPPFPLTSSSLFWFQTCCLARTRAITYVCCICWCQTGRSQIQTQEISQNYYLRLRHCVSMIFTWRFQHNISHYLPMNVVSVKTPLMVRDEFYIQMLFHLKIHFLIP